MLYNQAQAAGQAASVGYQWHILHVCSHTQPSLPASSEHQVEWLESVWDRRSGSSKGRGCGNDDLAVMAERHQ